MLLETEDKDGGEGHESQGFWSPLDPFSKSIRLCLGRLIVDLCKEKVMRCLQAPGLRREYGPSSGLDT